MMRDLWNILRERARARRRPAVRGFTLLEVMIVLAIIGLIAGSIGIGVFSQFKKGQIKTAKVNVTEIANAAVQYMVENSNECPNGMDDLVANKNLKKKIKDPWGQDFILKCPGENGDVDVVSKGPDKQEGTEDDVRSD